MILAIDAGNTRVKWGWHDGARWTALRNIALAELQSRPNDPFADSQERPSQIVISNVAGAGVGQVLLEWTAAFGIRPLWLRPERRRCGVLNLYESPEQLGTDRWAALIAARALHPGDCLVVCAGTATTADVLNRRGEFIGGIIFPGVALMKSSLHQNTGGLPLAEGSVRAAPRNTLDAIESGCGHAQAGALERMRRALPADAACLISGGAGESILELLPFPARYVENLVLEGLAIVAASGPLASPA